jgi:DNA polymerase
MTHEPSRLRLWHALGLGPLWRARAQGAAAPPGAAAAPPVEPGALGWEALQEAVAACTACSLCRTRKQTVFAAGSRAARWMFIGEAPGAEEDARGEPFVGQAGRLLDNMLAAIGLGRAPGAAAPAGADGAANPAANPAADAMADAGTEAVYIANVLKCRPPGNRNPLPNEVADCKPFLLRQIELLQPRIIVLLGKFPVQALLATDATIASLRGRVHELTLGARRYPVIVTYHPAYLLRTLGDKAKAWDDLCLARATYERLAPPGQGSAAAPRRTD